MSVNKVIILGRLGRDPELKAFPSGDPYCNFSLATSDRWKDKQGNQQEKTEWHNATATGKAAEIIAQYVKKGDELYIEGSIETRKWTDKDGTEKMATQIKVREFSFVGGKSDRGGDRPANGPPSRPANSPPPQSPPSRPAPQTPPPTPPPGERYDDDDIPF
jgi:single-strand DNA-binding protein